MLYLVNPGGRPKRRGRPARRKATGRTTRKGGTVAKRKRSTRRRSVRRRSTARKTVRRARSRVSMSHPRSVVISNPRRRRRRSVARSTARRRRRYHRNPSLSVRGIMGVAVEGGVIVVGQWGAARIAELVASKVIPSGLAAKSPLAATAAANIVAAVTTSLVARKVAPRHARLLAAAAWAQAISNTASATAVGARILSGSLTAPSPVVAPAASSGVAGYANARARLNGYARSGYNVTAGREGMEGYAASRGMSVGGGF